MVKELLALEVEVFISHVEFSTGTESTIGKKNQDLFFALRTIRHSLFFRSKAPLPHVYEQSPVIVGVIVGGDMRGRSSLKY